MRAGWFGMPDSFFGKKYKDHTIKETTNIEQQLLEDLIWHWRDRLYDVRVEINKASTLSDDHTWTYHKHLIALEKAINNRLYNLEERLKARNPSHGNMSLMYSRFA